MWDVTGKDTSQYYYDTDMINALILHDVDINSCIIQYTFLNLKFNNNQSFDVVSLSNAILNNKILFYNFS